MLGLKWHQWSCVKAQIAFIASAPKNPVVGKSGIGCSGKQRGEVR
jgi:hypothetical protein